MPVYVRAQASNHKGLSVHGYPEPRGVVPSCKCFIRTVD